MTTSATAVPASAPADERIVLQVVQPGLLGLMDGSVSTLAPLFATAELTGSTRSALFVGLAAALGAAISMGLAEALSDDGKVSGRGDPWFRGAITAVGTALGGMFHTLPFLMGNLGAALSVAYVSPLGRTVVQVIVRGAIVFFVGLWLGRFGAAG